jgi:3-hydroxyacyl-[acyl-carrier-protein] dehydratase
VPPPPIIDPQVVADGAVIADRDAIGELNPHRYEFRLLDAITYCDLKAHIFGGYLDLHLDDWWARGHIPGRPLFPGVLQVECAAQLASYLHHKVFQDAGFLGFVGLDDVKFRGMVIPPARLIMIARGKEVKRRRTICECQGFVDSTMVFEGTITGMTV